MDLELATIYDIADELAKRGVQFIIAIQVINNNEPFKLHLCTDGKKNNTEVAQVLIPFFESGEHLCSDSEPE